MLPDIPDCCAPQSYQYNAPVLGTLGAVLTPASYSQTGASAVATLERLSGMTLVDLTGYPQFKNTNLITMQVQTQNRSAEPLWTPGDIATQEPSLYVFLYTQQPACLLLCR
jgi:hypothetical protein